MSLHRCGLCTRWLLCCVFLTNPTGFSPEGLSGIGLCGDMTAGHLKLWSEKGKKDINMTLVFTPIWVWCKSDLTFFSCLSVDIRENLLMLLETENEAFYHLLRLSVPALCYCQTHFYGFVFLIRTISYCKVINLADLQYPWLLYTVK